MEDGMGKDMEQALVNIGKQLILLMMRWIWDARGH